MFFKGKDKLDIRNRVSNEVHVMFFAATLITFCYISTKCVTDPVNCNLAKKVSDNASFGYSFWNSCELCAQNHSHICQDSPQLHGQ